MANKKKRLYSKITALNSKIKIRRLYVKTLAVVDKRPLTSFFIIIAILIFTIIAGNIFKTPENKNEEAQIPVKLVRIYNIGSAPKITVQAQIEKSGIVKIVAQTPGIVSQINVETGQKVWRGSNLFSLSSGYGGGNPLSVQRQLAEAQSKHILDTFQTQKDLISQQRELVDNNRDNAQNIRDITKQSIDETNSLLSLNDTILQSISDNLTTLQNNNVGGINDAAILQIQQLKSQFQGATNQIRQGQRNTQYQSDSDNPPAKIADLGHNIAIKQLELQDKSLDLSKQTSALQLQLTRINEASFFPSSPFEGVVERVHVQIGQSVSPGTVLATIAGSEQTSTAIAFVPITIAKNISKLHPSIVHIADRQVELTPVYISQEATEGQLYSIVFAIPDQDQGSITDKSFITIDLPLSQEYSSGINPYVPIDSVHQTEQDAFIFITKNDTAFAKKVVLGEVHGSYIQILDGLDINDQVILNRNIIAGDKVEASK